jgi:hypothetical protein
MYSYEDRIRAVKLYIKLDKRIAATIIQLGYPTKNALVNFRSASTPCWHLLLYASRYTNERI